MSSIKRHNHRIHPCAPERKEALLQHLITCNESSSILIVTAHDPKALQEFIDDKSIIVTDDEGLADFPELMRDIVISYDLPSVPEVYSARVSHAITHALILLDSKDQINLYPVETLLGRTIMQDVISGFEPAGHKEQPKGKRPVKINDYNAIDNRNAKPHGEKKPYGEKKDRKPYADKGNRSLKPQEKPKGKRVSIKAIKPKEESE